MWSQLMEIFCNFPFPYSSSHHIPDHVMQIVSRALVTTRTFDAHGVNLRFSIEKSVFPKIPSQDHITEHRNQHISSVLPEFLHIDCRLALASKNKCSVREALKLTHKEPLWKYHCLCLICPRVKAVSKDVLWKNNLLRSSVRKKTEKQWFLTSFPSIDK